MLIAITYLFYLSVDFFTILYELTKKEKTILKNKLKIIIPVGISLIIIALAFVFIQFTPKAQSDAAAMIDKAYNFITEQNFEEAIAVFEKVIEIDPKNVDAYIGIAEAYEKNGDIDKAIEWLEKGFEITGSPLIAETLERLKKPAVTEENNEVEIMEEPIEDAAEDEIVVQEEELVKFVLPYNRDEMQNQISSHMGDPLSCFVYENLKIDGDWTVNNYSLYPFYKESPSSSHNGIESDESIGGLGVSWDGIWIYSFKKEDYFIPNPYSYSDYYNALPISVYRMDGTPIMEVTKYINSDSNLVKYEYSDENGYINTIEFQYDEAGNVISKSNNGLITNYKYDDNGNIIEVIKDTEILYKYEYDSMNNLIAYYVDNTLSHSFIYDDSGNLTKKYDHVTNGGFSTSYEYYDDGTLKSEYIEYNDGIWHKKSYAMNGTLIEYSSTDSVMKYDEHGYWTEYVDENVGCKRTCSNTYDFNGKLIKQIITDSSDEWGDSTYTETFQYDKEGNITNHVSEFSNRVNTGKDVFSFEYDASGRLLSEIVIYDGEECARYEYEYNSDGRAVKATEYWKGELKESAEVTEFIEVAIPKSFLDELMKYAE